MCGYTENWFTQSDHLQAKLMIFFCFTLMAMLILWPPWQVTSSCFREFFESMAKSLGHSSFKDIQKDMPFVIYAYLPSVFDKIMGTRLLYGHLVYHERPDTMTPRLIMTQLVIYCNIFLIKYIAFMQACNARFTRPLYKG